MADNIFTRVFGLIGGSGRAQTVAGVAADTQSLPREAARHIIGAEAARELAMLPRDGDVESLAAMGEMIVQTKMDGIRALYIDGRIVTREGGPLDCALHCQSALRRLEEAFGQPMMFDGEYVATGGFNATVAEQRRGEGSGTLWLFDAVPMAAWRSGGWDAGTHDRVAALKGHFLAGFNSPFVGMLDYKLDTVDGAVAFAKALWAIGGEGIVCKRHDAPYSRARSASWLRLKERHTMDLPILDVILRPGTTHLHKLIVKGPEGMGPITLGTGWTAAAEAVIVGYTRSHYDLPLVEVEFGLTTGIKRSVRGARFRRLRLDLPVSRDPLAARYPKPFITDEPDNYGGKPTPSLGRKRRNR